MLPAAGHVPGDPGSAAAVGPDARLRGGSPGGTWWPNEGWQLRWARKIQSRSLLRHIRGTFWHWGGQNPWRADSADGQRDPRRRAEGRNQHFPEGGHASFCHESGRRTGRFCLLLSGVWGGVRGAGGKGLRKGRRKARRPGTRGDEERGQRLHVLSPGHTDARRPGPKLSFF